MFHEAEVWLSLDLSSSAGSVAVHRFRRGRLLLLSEVGLPDGGRHSESVLAGIHESVNRAHLTLREVSRYLTNRGPGSFTGLRIAFSTLKAFTLAMQRPID